MGFPSVDLPKARDPQRKHVLACVDGSDGSHRMLDHAGFILEQALNQDVTLLAISRKGHVGEKEVNDILLKSKEILVSDGISAERIRSKVIPETDAAKAIIKEAGSERFAAVAVGRTGKAMGFFKKVFVGSVSRNLFQDLEGAALWLV